jgi:hypothetical protein
LGVVQDRFFEKNHTTGSPHIGSDAIEILETRIKDSVHVPPRRDRITGMGFTWVEHENLTGPGNMPRTAIPIRCRAPFNKGNYEVIVSVSRIAMPNEARVQRLDPLQLRPMEILRPFLKFIQLMSFHTSAQSVFQLIASNPARLHIILATTPCVKDHL